MSLRIQGFGCRGLFQSPRNLTVSSGVCMYICMYVCMYVCLSEDLPQRVLFPRYSPHAKLVSLRFKASGVPRAPDTCFMIGGPLQFKEYEGTCHARIRACPSSLYAYGCGVQAGF